MITLTLDWHEVLWWMQGGMAGSHIRWSVYEDMVNKVWPQCSEQERRNLWFIMRRDLGYSWRPDGWSGFDRASARGEGAWKADDKGYAIDHEDASGKPYKAIFDLTPWMYFRQVLARFDPENQYAVTMAVRNKGTLDSTLRFTPPASIISQPNLSHFKRDDDWESDTVTITVRTYKWHDYDGNNAYFIDWRRRCDPDKITKIEKLEIPDNGTM